MRPVCSVVDTSVCPAGDRVGLAAVLKSSQNLWGAGNPSDNPSPSDNPRESRTPSNPGTWGAMTRRLGRIVQPVLWGHPLFWDPQTGSLASGTQVCRASASFLVAPHLISRSRNQERTLGLFQQRLLLSLLQTLSNLSFGEPKGRMGRAEPPSNHLILCHPLLLPPSIFPSIRVFSKGRQRSRVSIPDSPGESGLVSRVSTSLRGHSPEPEAFPQFHSCRRHPVLAS